MADEQQLIDSGARDVTAQPEAANDLSEKDWVEQRYAQLRKPGQPAQAETAKPGEREAGWGQDGQDPEAAEVTQERAENGQYRPKHKGGFQKRIDKLTHRTKSAEAEANYWKEKAISGGFAPLSDDMDPEEWARIRNAQVNRGVPYTAEDPEAKAAIADKVAAERKAGEESEGGEAVANIEFPDGYHRQVAAAIVAHEDFDAVSAAAAQILLPTDLARAISLQPNSVEIAYALASAPEFHDELVQLFESYGPVVAGMELARISSDLRGMSAPALPPPEKRPALPAPLKPVKKSSPTETGLSDDLDEKEWLKRRYAQIAKQKQGR